MVYSEINPEKGGFAKHMQQPVGTDKGALIIIENPLIELKIANPLPSESSAYDDAEVLSETAHLHEEFDVIDDEDADKDDGFRLAG
jgi:hypothetical protein